MCTLGLLGSQWTAVLMQMMRLEIPVFCSCCQPRRDSRQLWFTNWSPSRAEETWHPYLPTPPVSCDTDRPGKPHLQNNSTKVLCIVERDKNQAHTPMMLLFLFLPLWLLPKWCLHPLHKYLLSFRWLDAARLFLSSVLFTLYSLKFAWVSVGKGRRPWGHEGWGELPRAPPAIPASPQHFWSCRCPSQRRVWSALTCLILPSWSWLVWAKVFPLPQHQGKYSIPSLSFFGTSTISCKDWGVTHLLSSVALSCSMCPILNRHSSRIPGNCFQWVYPGVGKLFLKSRRVNISDLQVVGLCCNC